jgi:putative polyhydroxyalkanoate system protein
LNGSVYLPLPQPAMAAAPRTPFRYTLRDAPIRPNMPTISIQRRHKLEHKKAKAAAQKIAKDLHERFDLQCTWDGDNVSFQRPGLSGDMRVGKNDVELNVKLSFLMTPLKGPIENAIRSELDTLFGEA